MTLLYPHYSHIETMPSRGCSDLVDAVRFGMDYVYAAVSFGRHAVEDAAGRVSPASPVPEARTLRQMLRAHRRYV